MQIGFCQLITPFSRHGGVGDDISSFAFDGYRKVKWNRDKKDFGRIWDVGDVLGVCIDMDSKFIEYSKTFESMFFSTRRSEEIFKSIFICILLTSILNGAISKVLEKL